jgi:sulfate-transporting ATPase
MQEVIQFALIGIGTGALYTLASQGLILIYRGSGVLNFAHGAVGMLGAYFFYELSQQHGVAFFPALLGGVLLSALIGALIHLVIMRQLRRASPLARVVATLGVLISLESVAVLRYGGRVTFLPSSLPTGIIKLFGSVTITDDKVILLGLSAVLTVALWALYKYTKFGLGTSAVAENERAAASLGWSPDVIAAANWALGSGLAGLAAILISPIVTLQVSVMTNLVLSALAVALVANFRSFPIAFAAGLGIGVAQTLLERYTTLQGLYQSLPFFVIVIVLIVRGQALPLRDFLLQRLPTVGTGRIRPHYALGGLVIGVLLITILPVAWVVGITLTLGPALVLLSVVVVTGYAGQLSLAQFSFAGFGAWIAGRAMVGAGLPFWLSVVLALLAAIPVGMLFALPALRTRGITLAVVTLGLGTAVEYMIFDSAPLTGGLEGTDATNPKLFGLNIDPVTHATRFALFSLALFVVAALLVANVRRGRSGRRLIAVRTNERAAAALGINVSSAKLYAFGLSAAIAALGGIIVGFQTEQISYSTTFTNFTSVDVVGFAMIGGIGYVMGPIVGGTLFAGSVGTVILDDLLSSSAGKYLPLIGGVIVILLVLQNQDGVVKEQITQIAWVRNKIRRGKQPPTTPSPLLELGGERSVKVAPRQLEVRGLTVRYGSTTAVEDLSFTIKPGEVLGLIGPNGAGKTTVIDAVTGFTAATAGELFLDDVAINRWGATRRARAGLSRSFQSLELFEDSTVLDNLRTASDPPDLISYARDPLYPVNPALGTEVVAAIREFKFEADLEHAAQDLPYGKRRLLAIARAVATHPSVLLLDEPAAGLGDAETAELAELTGRLARDWGMAILLIEHDMNFVMSVCDRLVVIDFGRKIAEGTPAVVRQDPAVLAAYLGETEEELKEETVLASAASSTANVSQRL